MVFMAIEKGYITGIGLIESGQEFEYSGPVGPWMIPVEQAPPVKEVKAEALTMHQMTVELAEQRHIAPPASGTKNTCPAPKGSLPAIKQASKPIKRRK